MSDTLQLNQRRRVQRGLPGALDWFTARRGVETYAGTSTVSAWRNIARSNFVPNPPFPPLDEDDLFSRPVQFAQSPSLVQGGASVPSSRVVFDGTQMLHTLANNAGPGVFAPQGGLGDLNIGSPFTMAAVLRFPGPSGSNGVIAGHAKFDYETISEIWAIDWLLGRFGEDFITSRPAGDEFFGGGLTWDWDSDPSRTAIPGILPSGQLLAVIVNYWTDRIEVRVNGRVAARSWSPPTQIVSTDGAFEYGSHFYVGGFEAVIDENLQFHQVLAGLAFDLHDLAFFFPALSVGQSIQLERVLQDLHPSLAYERGGYLFCDPSPLIVTGPEITGPFNTPSIEVTNLGNEVLEWSASAHSDALAAEISIEPKHGRLQPGQTATLRLSANPGDFFAGIDIPYTVTITNLSNGDGTTLIPLTVSPT